MDPVTILSIFSAVVAAVWTAWTWREEHKEVRQLQRDQAAALYVNPLLFATHQMERQLQRLLDGGEPILTESEHEYRRESVSGVAIEVLWTFAEFFAWAAVNLRYGPYARDPNVVGLIVALSRTFDDRERFGDGAFRFSTAEQESLGQAVLRRVGHASSNTRESSCALTEFAILTAVEFERDFRDAQSAKAGLYGGRAVRTAVAAIDRAGRADQLESRERLAAVRELLGALLEHLERLEGFSVSHGNLESPRILHRIRGRIRVGIPEIRRNEALADRLAAFIRTWEDVEHVNVNVLAGSIAIRHRTTVSEGEFDRRILAAIERAVHQNASAPPRPRLQGTRPDRRARPRRRVVRH